MHATFSPDGQRVVTASEDYTARLWDVASGEALAVFKGHEAGSQSRRLQPRRAAAW